MQYLIADTFTGSLAKLTGDEQKAVKTTAFDLQLDPASPGMQFHRLDKIRDKHFWSVRVNADIRLIVHKTGSSLLLCYVDHHDKAYRWAETRKLETHPKTGAAQLVEIRETVQEIVIPTYVDAPLPRKSTKPRRIFAELAEEELLGYGVPLEWLADVREATEDSLLGLVDHLPGEAAEALLELATGGRPRPAVAASASGSPFEHPDAQRRFRVMTNVAELQQALDQPWEKWTVFLHPEQRQLVARDYNGPTRVSGSAGTGKTIVALHRAAHLARANPTSRVLLGTFSDDLARALQTRLALLLGPEAEVLARVSVRSLDALGQELYREHVGAVQLADAATIRRCLEQAGAAVEGHGFSRSFLSSEWAQIVDAWQLESWEAYRDVARLGRRTRLTEAQRRRLWSIFERVHEELLAQGLVTASAVYTRLAARLPELAEAPFQFAVIDEAQDLGVAQLRFLAGLGGSRPNALFFAGDLGQRIFQQPFSWKALGVDIRGRSRTLRVNYRTSHQIRQQADRLLGETVTDVDGNAEDRSDTVSVFNGPPPDLRVLADTSMEMQTVAEWLKAQLAAGIRAEEIGLFVRSERELPYALSIAEQAGIPVAALGDRADPSPDCINVSTMHLAKGLEFRSVAVISCNDEVIPLQERIESVGDEAELQEVYETERHLLYVACTRAREHLLVTGVSPASEFLEDLGSVRRPD